MDSQSTPQVSSDAIDPDLTSGQVVGEYVVDGKLGQGGFGAVFRASHPLIGKVVAIKVLARRFSVDPEMVSRFVAEARAVNQIRHRNIIDIFSFGQLEDGRHYYVMEYLDGEPLDRRIKRQTRIPLHEAVPILRSIARALDAAHAKGIAHRDLKAENVFLGVDSDGAVFPKLLDFGIAKLMGTEDAIGHKTRTGAPMGTPYYMSPEQCRGRDVDHRTDLYAFGVLAYLMVTGVFPIDGDDYMTILMRQLEDEPVPAGTLVADLPEGVDHVVSWLMRKEPADRPPDLITAVRALEEVAGLVRSTEQVAAARTPSALVQIPSSITSRPPGSTRAVAADSIAPAPRRGRAVAVVAALAVAAAVVIAVVVLRGAKGGEVAAPRDAAVVARGPAPDAAPDATATALVPPDAAASSPTVTITLDGTPPGTEVKIGGKHVGTAPGAISLPRGELEIVLSLTAPGYAPLQLPVTPSADGARKVALRPLKTPPGKGSGSHVPAGKGSASQGSGSGFVPTNEIENFPN